jgi:hypothetical protein
VTNRQCFRACARVSPVRMAGLTACPEVTWACARESTAGGGFGWEGWNRDEQEQASGVFEDACGRGFRETRNVGGSEFLAGNAGMASIVLWAPGNKSKG